MTLRKWHCASIITACLLAFATVSAVGWDVTQKWVSFQSCEDINYDILAGQRPQTSCLDGFECVACDDGVNLIGDIVSKDGTGERKESPHEMDCTGDKLIGICTGSACDTSMAIVDGECGGVLYEYQTQKVQTPPGG